MESFGRARAARHPADDPAQHAVPGDGVPDGVPAPAARSGAGRSRSARPTRRSSCSCGCSAGRGWARPPSSCRRAPPDGKRRGPDRTARRAVAPLPRRTPSRYQRHRRRRRPVPAGPRPGLALRIAGRAVPARGPALRRPAAPTGRRRRRAALAWAFGELGIADRAKHLASLYIDDLADVIRDGIDPRFELSRYGEKLAASAATFDPPGTPRWTAPPTLVDEHARRASPRELLRAAPPDLVGLTVPFPGNVYGALPHRPRRQGGVARRPASCWAAATSTPSCASSPTRACSTTVDYVTLDDGERPLLALIEHLRRPATARRCSAPSCARRGASCCSPTAALPRHAHCATTGTPTYDGLPLDRYVSLFEMLNPMHRLWSDGRWNKLTVAHGCYWKKCTFCDVSLDYIGRYEPASADLLVDRIEALIDETGQTGFHFVDEAAPPAGAARAGRAADRARGGHHLVGQHPLREDLHPGAGRAAGALGLRRGQRRPRGRLGSAAGADEEGRHRRAGGARHAAPSPTPASWCTPI